MRRIKSMIFGIIIGTGLGLWLGFNMGKDRPLLSNPFEEPDLKEKIRDTGDTLIEKSGEALERSGQALQQRSQPEQPEQDEQPLPVPEYPQQ